MRPSGKRLKRSSARFLCIASAAMILSGCNSSMQRSDQVSPLVRANCPPLTPLNDDTFGATTVKLIEVAGLYHRCRAAALGELK